MPDTAAIEGKFTNLIGQFFVLKNREILIDRLTEVVSEPAQHQVVVCNSLRVASNPSYVHLLHSEINKAKMFDYLRQNDKVVPSKPTSYDIQASPS